LICQVQVRYNQRNSNYMIVVYHSKGIYRPGDSGGDSESSPTLNLRCR